jgi:hypothetical protein
VSSQRAREQRIVERLHEGALTLAAPSDLAHPTHGRVGACSGCLEPEADARIGDQAWHFLCALYWQGRSETLREQRIPHTQPGSSITPERSRWVIVVPVGRSDTYVALRRSFARSPWVDVVMDRRRGERRRQESGPEPLIERRTTPRRKGAARDPAPDSAFRLAHQMDGCEVYESTAPESGHCPECRALISAELPRFTEPPMRLDLVVQHESIPGGARHVMELQSFSPTGRVLLATRLTGHARPSEVS